MVSPQHEVFFLLGLEPDWSQRGASYCDFGGKTDLRADGESESAAETAVRELDEESLGLVRAPDVCDLEQRGAAALEICFYNRRRRVVSKYTTFCVQVNWDPLLPYAFSCRRRQRQRQHAPSYELEKQRIDIIPSARLRDAVRGVRGAPKLRKTFVARIRTALQCLGLDHQPA